MKFIASLFIPVLLLTGCAVKPTVTDDDYDKAAKLFRGAHYCHQQGNYTTSTKIRVQQTIVEALYGRYSGVTEAKMKQAVDGGYDADRPTRENCEELAELVGQYRSRQQPVYVQPSTPAPVQTTCNRIGFQTYCTTY